MKLIFKLIIITAITLALFYCWHNPEIRNSFTSFERLSLLRIGICYLLFYALNAFALLILARKSSKEIKFFQMLGISQYSGLIGYTLPFRIANLGVRAIYLKKRFNISYGETIGGGLLVTLMGLIISALTALAFSVNYIRDIVDTRYWLAIGISVLLAITLTCLYKLKNSIDGYLSTRFSSFESLKRGVTQLTTTDVITLILITSITFLVTGFINLALINGVGMTAPFSLCLLLAAVSNISFLIALAPANLGTKELLYIGIGALYGLSTEGIIAFLIIDRLVQIAFLSISSAIFYFVESPSGHLK